MTDKHGQAQGSIENAEEIIERFGGIRPMANKMKVPVTTIQGWKKRNIIPGNRRAQILEAAKKNHVSLSGLVENNAVNENTAAAPDKKQSVAGEHNAFSQDGDRVAIAKKLDDAATKEAAFYNQDMLRDMERAQSVNFNKSMWFTVGFVTFVVLLSVLLLWPEKKQLDRNSHNIAQLQEDMSGVQKKQSFLSNLVPGDLDQRVARLQEQARTIEQTVTALGSQVDVIARETLEPDQSMATRIRTLEDHATKLGAPVQLVDMLRRVAIMQESLEGQSQLSGGIVKLNALLQGMQQDGENEETIEMALMRAQQEDSSLGQALQGVAPQDMKAAVMLLGLTQFRHSLNRSAPFEEDLVLMQNLPGMDDPELQSAISKLAPKAASGLLTPEGLKNEFKGLAGDIVVSSLKGEDIAIKEKARARFNELLSVEKEGELLTGTETQIKVARAQKLLDEGNIQGAIIELQGLEGEAAQTAQPFIENAQFTMLAEKLQGMFADRVIMNIGQSASTGSVGTSQLIGEIKKLAPHRRIFKDEESGLIILEPVTGLSP